MEIGRVKFSSVAMVALLMAGCGGGGGGEGNDASTNQLTLDAQGYGDKQAALRVQGDFEDAIEAYSAIDGVVTLIEDVESSLGSSGGTTVAAASTSTEPALTCANAEGVVTIDQTVTSGSERYIYTFVNCRVETYFHGVLLLNGEYRSDVTASGDGSSAKIVEAIDIAGQNLDTGDALAIVGSQTTTLRASSETSFTLTTTSPSMEYRLGDEYVATRNSEFSVSQTAETITLRMTTDLVSSALNGYVSLSTPTPIEGITTADCPIRGHILLEGDGRVEARYGESAGRGYGLEVLVNGSDVSYQDTCGAALPL